MSPVRKTSGRFSATSRKPRADHGPMPFTAVRAASTSSSVMRSSAASVSRPSTNRSASTHAQALSRRLVTSGSSTTHSLVVVVGRSGGFRAPHLGLDIDPRSRCEAWHMNALTDHKPRTAVSASGLRKTYGKKVVLDGIDLSIGEGEVFALLGPNGAGKTTIVRLLSTLIPADAGAATVMGLDLRGEAGPGAPGDRVTRREPPGGPAPPGGAQPRP